MRKTIVIAAWAILCAVPGFSAEKPMELQGVSSSLPMETTRELNSFCKAIIKGDIQTVKRLIALGEDVNKKSLGKTPVIFAARYNKAEIVKLLLDNGADPSIRCESGYNAKKHAELSNAKEALAVINAHSMK
ncbi:ankyrin repeat domain-containing protein [Arenibacter lacus]|uniref:ankyrin repeat domain-containing protein n=1 Tax=Arenibacter lacus TaxID=2608629 RepID=UPI00123D34AF|nr:ankyrin repeat domain-containing protein [Arenibacter lacus]